MEKKHITEMLDDISVQIKSSADAVSILQTQMADKLANQFKLINESVIESARKMVELPKPTLAFSEALKSAGEFLYNIAEINRLYLEKQSKRWIESINQFHISEKVALKLLHKYKWFITPNMPADFIHKIAVLDKKKGNHTRAFNKLFIDYFYNNKCHNLEEMVLGWKKNPLFKKRMNIFIDCVHTIKTIQNTKINETSILLPTIISQIDGILTDYLLTKGIYSRCKYDDDIDKSGKIRKEGKKTSFIKFKNQILSDDMDQIFNNLFLNILFQKSSPRKKLQIPFNFNRHKILHGENTNYGRRDYLIRGFIILEYLSELK